MGGSIEKQVEIMTTLDIKVEWYNLEDRYNYDFSNYIVVTEGSLPGGHRHYNMIDDYEVAKNFKNKCEITKKKFP